MKNINLKLILITNIFIIIGIFFFFNYPIDKKAENMKVENTNITENDKTLNIIMKTPFQYDNGQLSSGVEIGYINKLLGKKLHYSFLGHSLSKYYNNLDLHIKTQKDSDLILIYDREKLMQYADNGVIYKIGDIIADQENLKRYISEDTWKMSQYNDSIYAIPIKYDPVIQTHIFIRKDWLGNLGLKIPKTIDEYYNVLYQFTYNDPDKNLLNDTVGLLVGKDLGMGNDIGTKNIFSDAFGAGVLRIENEKIYIPEAGEAYKNYLKFMHKLYSKGIMEKEFPILNFNQLLSKIEGGKYGMVTFYWNGIYENKKYLDENWIHIEPPLKENGEKSKNIWHHPMRYYIAVPKQCNTPENAIKILSDMLKEDIQLAKFYNYKLRDLIFISRENSPLSRQYKDEKGLNQYESSIKYGRIDAIYESLPYFSDLRNYNYDTVTEEYTIKAILGQLDIDATFDSYVKKWEDQGGSNVIENYENYLFLMNK